MKNILFGTARKHFADWSLKGLLASAACVLISSAHAQGPPEVRTPAPKPAVATKMIAAFTGNWVNDRPVVGVSRPGSTPFRPDYEKKVEELAKLAVAGKEVPGNEPKCIPNGPAMELGFGMQVFADAQQMVLIITGPRIRNIWVDGRSHPPDNLLFPSYDGDSVSHWDGDTLVVDTVGLEATDEIVFGVAVNDDKMHMIERWRIVSPGKLQIQTTIEDERALSHPWTYQRTYTRVPAVADSQYCVSSVDRTRDGGFDLTPPAGGYVPPDAKK